MSSSCSVRRSELACRRGSVSAGSRAPSARTILAAATERSGRDGYDDTKWADIASDGVGPTALYHYFESKQHSRFVTMDQAIENFHVRFEPLSNDNPGHLDALVAIVRDRSALDEHDIQRNRVLVAEERLLVSRSQPPREEEAHHAGRERIRELESAWATLLARAMEQGAIPDREPRLLTRAILGFYNSIWHWYRPNAAVVFHRAAEFCAARILALVGRAPEQARSRLLAA